MIHALIADFSSGMVNSVDSDVLPMRAAAYTYNFDTRRGTLVNGLGVERLNLGGSIPDLKNAPEGVWLYTRTTQEDVRDDRLVAFCNGALYQLKLYGEGARTWSAAGATFSACPTAINYRLNGNDVLILCSGSDAMCVLDGETAEQVADSPSILSMCVHYERLWAVSEGSRDCVWFSSDLDPTNWDVSLTGAGFISMPDERGRALKVLSFMDYVYVFREHGITRLSAYADQSQFSVSHLFTSSGTIYGDTVCICGDRILFAAGDGLYAFDGLQTTKILKHLTFTLDASTAHAAFAEGKYYLSTKFDFLDQEGSVDVLLVYDLAGGSVLFFKGQSVSRLATVASGNLQAVVALIGTKTVGQVTLCGKVFDRPTVKVWATPYTDIGRPDKLKVLNSLTVMTKQPLTIVVNRDGMTDRYELNGGSAPQRIRLHGAAYRLGFVFECASTDVYVTCPLLEYTVKGGS